MKKTLWVAGIMALLAIVVVGTASIALGRTGGSKESARGEQSPKYDASINVDEKTVEGLSEAEEEKARAPGQDH